MQSLKSKVAAEKAAQGALEENDGARRKLRKAVAARDAAYALDDGAEALLLRALDAFADRGALRDAVREGIQRPQQQRLGAVVQRVGRVARRDGLSQLPARAVVLF